MYCIVHQSILTNYKYVLPWSPINYSLFCHSNSSSTVLLFVHVLLSSWHHLPIFIKILWHVLYRNMVNCSWHRHWLYCSILHLCWKLSTNDKDNKKKWTVMHECDNWKIHKDTYIYIVCCRYSNKPLFLFNYIQYQQNIPAI